MIIPFEEVLEYLSKKEWNLSNNWKEKIEYLISKLEDPNIKIDDKNSIKRYIKYFKTPLTFKHDLTTYKTGRIFSNYVLLPNKPIYNIFLKELLIPKKGYIFVSFDYNASQIRHLAEFKKLKKLKEIFKNDKDFYKEFANEINLDRKEAKIIVLSLLFGGNEKTIRKNFPLMNEKEIKKIKEIFDNWFKTEGMPYNEKVELNHSIQKAEVEFMKKKLTHIYKKQNTEFNLHAFIHDEIIIEMKKDALYHIEKIKKYLEKNPNGIKMKVKVSKSKTMQFK